MSTGLCTHERVEQRRSGAPSAAQADVRGFRGWPSRPVPALATTFPSAASAVIVSQHAHSNSKERGWRSGNKDQTISD